MGKSWKYFSNEIEKNIFGTEYRYVKEKLYFIIRLIKGRYKYFHDESN